VSKKKETSLSPESQGRHLSTQKAGGGGGQGNTSLSTESQGWGEHFSAQGKITSPRTGEVPRHREVGRSLSAQREDHSQHGEWGSGGEPQHREQSDTQATERKCSISYDSLQGDYIQGLMHSKCSTVVSGQQITAWVLAWKGILETWKRRGARRREKMMPLRQAF
jgi:hypothetical protein